MILRDFSESFQIPVSILFDLDQDLQEAGHGPGLDGVAVAAELTLGIGQLRNAAPLGRLDLDEVSREHRHHELLGLGPLLVAADQSGEVEVRAEEESDRPHPFRTLKNTFAFKQEAQVVR